MIALEIRDIIWTLSNPQQLSWERTQVTRFKTWLLTLASLASLDLIVPFVNKSLMTWRVSTLTWSSTPAPDQEDQSKIRSSLRMWPRIQWSRDRGGWLPVLMLGGGSVPRCPLSVRTVAWLWTIIKICSDISSVILILTLSKLFQSTSLETLVINLYHLLFRYIWLNFLIIFFFRLLPILLWASTGWSSRRSHGREAFWSTGEEGEWPWRKVCNSGIIKIIVTIQVEVQVLVTLFWLFNIWFLHYRLYWPRQID